MSDLSVYNYADYRDFLRDYYLTRKKVDSSYSFRRFALKARLASPNYLKLVIDGKRRITEKNISQFIRGLGLSDEEARFFRALVGSKESRLEEERQAFKNEAEQIKSQASKEAALIEEAHYKFLESWKHLSIRELVHLKNFREDPTWIKEILRFEVSEVEISESIELQLEIGFLKRNEEGFLECAEPLLTTGDDVESPVLRQLHTQFLQMALDSVSALPKEEREVNHLTLAIQRSQLQAIKDAIRNFRKSLNKIIAPVNNADEVVHLSIALFPITHPPQRGESS